MPTLVIPKTYRDGKAPRVVDLDNIRLTLESFFNDTKVDATNINLASISSALSATQSQTLITSSGFGEINDSADAFSSVSVTVEATGYYIVYCQTEKSLSAGDAAVTTTYITNTSVVTFSINGVTSYTFNLETTLQLVSGLGTIKSASVINSGGFSFAKALTEGDILTLDVPGAITLVKLVET